MAINPDKDSLSDAHLRAIGRVIVEWQILEDQIEAAVWTLLFVDPQKSSPWLSEREGRAITTHLTTPLRLDMILTLSDTKQIGPCREPLKELISRVRPLMAQRNTVAHALWSMSPKGTVRQTYKARGKLKSSVEFVTSDSLNDLADAISTEAERLKSLNKTIAEYIVLVESS